MTRFTVGQCFEFTDWFAGGCEHYKIIERNEKELIAECIAEEIDGTHHREETFTIEEDVDSERILICEYKGSKGYICAKDLAEIKAFN